MLAASVVLAATPVSEGHRDRGRHQELFILEVTMSYTFSLRKGEVSLTTINCGRCGGIYAINERYRAQKEEEGGSWNCPYCKVGWGYSDNNENSRLRREKAALEQRLREEKIRTQTARVSAQFHKNQAIAYKGHKTRLQKRIKAGVCPCCNRTFKQLAEHMASEHPDYKADE